MPDFDAVWQRVRRLEPDMPALLEGFLQKACEAAGAYAALARGTRARPARRLFLTHAAEEMESVRRLQAAYYLLTGDSLPLKQGKADPAPGLFAAMQQQHAREQASAEAYRSAAAAAPSAELRELFAALGRMDAAHAAALHQLVDRLL